MEPLKLLLLDNDRATLGFLQDQFRRKNDQIHVCEKPSGLVQFFGKDLPDVVILASEWSDNALETLDLLKKEWEDLPVIFVSKNGSVPEVVHVMKKGARDRYFHEEGVSDRALIPEGIEGRVPYKGNVSALVLQLIGGLRSGMGYCGCKSIEELKTDSRFIRITKAGLRESHPHDVTITREAPNYRLD